MINLSYFGVHKTFEKVKSCIYYRRSHFNRVSNNYLLIWAAAAYLVDFLSTPRGPDLSQANPVFHVRPFI